MYTPLFQSFDFNWKFDYTNNKNVFHYTNINALRSILENRELWATKSNFLNDYTETVYILEIFDHVHSVIKERFNEQTNEFFRLLAEDIGSRFINYQNESYFNSMFVISLSENADSLTLWSQYSSTDGYNIGLDLNGIITNTQQLKSSNSLFDFCYFSKIIYDIDKQISILFNELIRIYDFFKANDDGQPERMNEALFICKTAIETYSLFFKRPGFKQEEEYRIAFTIFNKEKIDNNINYRIGSGSFVPFIKIPFLNGVPIANITIGPKNNIDISRYGLIHYLEHRGYSQLRNGIYKSQITLRY